MKRKIWYACGDPTNRFWLRRWLRKMGRGLSCDANRAVFRLADLDHLPFGMTTADLIELFSATPMIPSAVHGHNVDRDTRYRLRQMNVHVFRRLTRETVRRLVCGPVGGGRGHRASLSIGCLQLAS
jgi:hypothetical protein